jgi:predicted methyltransferase
VLKSRDDFASQFEVYPGARGLRILRRLRGQFAGDGRDPSQRASAAISCSERAAHQRRPAAQAAIAAALAGPQRSESNRARDPYRHPSQTLAFFGLTPSAHVVELWPGGGWYTEVLAPVLRDAGSLSAVVPSGQSATNYRAFLAAQPSVFDRVQVVEVQPPTTLTMGPDASADMVLTFRNFHNWVSGGFASQLTAAVFRVLKPGGTYGVVEHRAKPGTSLEQSKQSGYVSEDVIIDLATKAGFVLDARSEVNANPKDTKDYAEGVWALPPSLRNKDVDREKYLAIGESDRMTLRFKKP